MFTHDFIKDFDRLIDQEEPFAFVRFHDGEHALLEGLPYRAASNWTSLGNDVWFRDELYEVLTTDLDQFYKGLSPPCCTPQAAYYYRNTLGGDHKEQTYATLFQFTNYNRARMLRSKFPQPLMIGSGNADIVVPKNGVTKQWDMDAVVAEMLKSSRPIFVAAGPCANILIYRYWVRQDKTKRRPVLDVGALFDLELHGHKTREYHTRASRTNNHVCAWDDWKPFAPVTAKQRIEAAERAEAQARFAELDTQKFNPNVVKKNDLEDRRSKKTGNLLVTTRKRISLGEGQTRRKSVRTGKNRLK